MMKQFEIQAMKLVKNNEGATGRSPLQGNIPSIVQQLLASLCRRNLLG